MQMLSGNVMRSVFYDPPAVPLSCQKYIRCYDLSDMIVKHSFMHLV